MRQLEEENLRLKKLVADLSLDKAMLQDVLAKELTLARLREWVRDLQARYGASERQVCFALQISRSSFRYRSVAADDSALRLRIRKSPKPGFIMATAEFTSCSGGRAGGIITNAFTGSIANRVCPASQTPAAEQIGAAATTAASGAVSESCLGHGFCL